MPKKIQHKGKPKCATEEDEDLVFRRKSNENIEDVYTTVVDFEHDKKYNKRLIKNNWSKYESTITDFENLDETKELPKTDDFSFLIKTASSDCSHFQFSSEKQWSNESTLPVSEIFSLDLSVLSSGLACVPFYERINLDESQLSVEDKERFDREAEDSLKEYNLVKEKNKKDASESSVKILNEPIKIDINVGEENVEKIGKLEEKSEEVQRTEKSKDEKLSPETKKLFFSENDENLEDWLDSVLDD